MFVVTIHLIRKNPGEEPQAIAVESLPIKNILGNHHLVKSISGAGWYSLAHILKKTSGTDGNLTKYQPVIPHRIVQNVVIAKQT